MSHELKIPKKLIEVALPLDDINAASVREKSIRHGHPSTLHLWWARRPLATARAVLFAQLVNDPGYERHLGRGVNREKAQKERERLFGIVRRLVKWENLNNPDVLAEARIEIEKSWRETCDLNRKHPRASEWFNPEKLPAFHDPFAGGGAIPLEAQRLGLDSYATDLNPVAVMINKAMIEIPPKFSGYPPIGPIPKQERQGILSQHYNGARGLAEDVRRYGYLVGEMAEKKLRHLYPPVVVDEPRCQRQPELRSLLGKELTVIAWIWVRTVPSPHPAFADQQVPLLSSAWLSSKAGKEAWVEIVVDAASKTYDFRIHRGSPDKELANGTKMGRGSNFRCVFSEAPIDPKHVKEQFRKGAGSARLVAIVCDGPGGRLYVAPDPEQECAGLIQDSEQWRPDTPITNDPTTGALSVRVYGFERFGQLFTDRQLTVLNTLNEASNEVAVQIAKDARNSDAHRLCADNYAQAVRTYLAFCVDKVADYSSTQCSWNAPGENMRSSFARQALPMVWDFAEVNPFSRSSGNWSAMVDWCSKALAEVPARGIGVVYQADSQTQNHSQDKVVSTDPPYYDNIPYSDLSDFFYVWLRIGLRSIYPRIFSTLSTPKDDELVALPDRRGGRVQAEQFFMEEMTKALGQLVNQAHPAIPVTIYYAFKQAETTSSGTASTGWETFLQAVILSGFQITGTWPVRTERSNRMRGQASNALASSVVLVCRQRDRSAPTTTRRAFIRELTAVLPEALEEMIHGSENSAVAPVDLAQSIIGPGIAIFSKYRAVLEPNGEPMSVRTALMLINRFFAEEEFDRETQFCLHWFELKGWAEGTFDEGDRLARAKGTSVEGVKGAGVLEAGQNKVRLLRPAEFSQDWDPAKDTRIPIWESLQRLTWSFRTGGQEKAGLLMSKLPGKMEATRSLAYRLYTICERRGWAEDARPYDELVKAWDFVEKIASNLAPDAPRQMEIF